MQFSNYLFKFRAVFIGRSKWLAQATTNHGDVASGTHLAFQVVDLIIVKQTISLGWQKDKPFWNVKNPKVENVRGKTFKNVTLRKSMEM